MRILGFIFFISTVFSPLKKMEEKPIVVLIHGFMGNHFNLSLIKYTLQNEGYEVVPFSYPSREKNIEEHGEDLANLLLRLSIKHKDQPIYFVTHSMGGLVLRSALNNEKCPNEAKIGKIAMIAPPNKGSLLARKLYDLKFPRKIFGYKSGRQMMVKDTFEYELPLTSKILIASGSFSINPLLRKEGLNDGIILDKETSLKNDHQKINVKAGHIGICYSPKVIKSIINFFNS